jgi:hypothetical protein
MPISSALSQERSGRAVCFTGARTASSHCSRQTPLPQGSHTQMAWRVGDIDAAVAQLKARGVVFEEYDLPGLTTVGGQKPPSFLLSLSSRESPRRLSHKGRPTNCRLDFPGLVGNLPGAGARSQ